MSIPVDLHNADDEVNTQNMDDEDDVFNLDTDVEQNLHNMDDCQEQSTSRIQHFLKFTFPNSKSSASTQKSADQTPGSATFVNDSFPAHPTIHQGISRSQSDPCRFQPLHSISLKGDHAARGIQPNDDSESALELNPNEILTDDNAAPRRGYAFIRINEYKKLKTEANEAERLKLKHSTLMEQHNTLLEQHNALLEQQKSKPQISDTEHEQLKLKAEKNDSIIEQLKSKIECPVCYEIPKRIPIPVCPNGHIVCQSCKQDDCPMCRESMDDGKSLVAATVVQNLLHDCDYVLYGCGVIQVKHADLVQHLDVCPYRFHNNGWTHLSEAAGIRLRGNFVDLGIKVTPVTSFYDYENARCHCLACQNRNHCGLCEKRNHLNFDHRKKVMWPPNAIEYDGTMFFLYVIADKYGSGIWRFIVEWGDDRMTGMDRVGAREKYRVRIVVFKPGDHGGCRRHFHQHSIFGKLDDKDQLILTLDNSLMQALFLDDKFAVTVEICQSDEVTTENNFGFQQVRYCCDVTRRGGRGMPLQWGMPPLF